MSNAIHELVNNASHFSTIPSIHDHVETEGYFAPLCTARHLSVRHYNLDVARWVGDCIHVLALLLCLAVILREEEGTEGVSFKTHLIYIFNFSARFINVFFCDQSIYLIMYKVLLWSFTLKIVVLMILRDAFKDKNDTLPLVAMLIPTFLVTIIFGQYSLQDHGLVAEILWIFSTYLEAIAMLPQYIYCYRDANNPSVLVFVYVLAMGGYRIVFGFSWAYHMVLRTSEYSDVYHYISLSSFLSGVVSIAFFADFLLFKVTKKSFLSRYCISVDDGIREVEEAARHAVEAVITTPRQSLPLPRELSRDANPLDATEFGKPSSAENLPGEVELAEITPSQRVSWANLAEGQTTPPIGRPISGPVMNKLRLPAKTLPRSNYSGDGQDKDLADGPL